MVAETPIPKEPISFEEAKEQLLAKMKSDRANCELYSSISQNVDAVALVFERGIDDARGLMDELLKIHGPHCGLIHYP